MAKHHIQYNKIEEIIIENIDYKIIFIMKWMDEEECYNDQFSIFLRTIIKLIKKANIKIYSCE